MLSVNEIESGEWSLQLSSEKQRFPEEVLGKFNLESGSGFKEELNLGTPTDTDGQHSYMFAFENSTDEESD